VVIPVSDNDVTPGARIRAMREHLGIPQSALSRRLGWPPDNGQLCNYERNRRPLTARQEARIVGAMRELIGESSDGR
jgi:hypothetical protein